MKKSCEIKHDASVLMVITIFMGSQMKFGIFCEIRDIQSQPQTNLHQWLN